MMVEVEETCEADDKLEVIGIALESSRSCLDISSGDIPKWGGLLESLSKSELERTGARSWVMLPVLKPRMLNVKLFVEGFDEESHASAPSLSSAALSKLAWSNLLNRSSLSLCFGPLYVLLQKFMTSEYTSNRDLE